MRRIMKVALSIVAVGSFLGVGTTSIRAHEPANAGGYGGYKLGYRTYYGNGGHDSPPHRHTWQTPFGTSSYYGLGRHDFRRTTTCKRPTAS